MTAWRVWERVGWVSAATALASYGAARLWPDSLLPWIAMGLSGEAAAFSVLGTWLERRRLTREALGRGRRGVGPGDP